MTRCTVVVGSVTAAMKGQKLLTARGIACTVERDSRASARYGCGYCIRVLNGCEEALQLLRDHRVRVLEVFPG